MGRRDRSARYIRTFSPRAYEGAQPGDRQYKSAARRRQEAEGLAQALAQPCRRRKAGRETPGALSPQTAGDDTRGRAPCLRRTGVASVRKTEMPRWLAAFLWGKAEHMLLNGIWRHTV